MEASIEAVNLLNHTNVQTIDQVYVAPIFSAPYLVNMATNRKSRKSLPLR